MNLAQKNRVGEDGPVPSRCDRFYLFESEWFFATREGAAVGPFATQETAKMGLQDYLEFLSLAKPRIRARLIRAMSR